MNFLKYFILFKAILSHWKLKGETGATHKRKTLEESVEYIKRVFNDYLQYGGLTQEDILDKTILEIGPGDNLGVALLFIARGARKVVCLDRFLCKRDDQQQIKIYEALLQTMDEKERQLIEAAITRTQEKIVFNSEKIQYVSGLSIEDAEKIFPGNSFDYIISRAVLQYVSDLEKAFHTMDLLLKEKGRLIHKIDMRDHGIFSSQGMNPLEFLTVPDALWNCLGAHAGKTNRQRINFYRDKLMHWEYDYMLFITHVMGQNQDIVPHKLIIQKGLDYSDEDIAKFNSIKPRLLKRFKILSDNDLLISGIFLVASKSFDPKFCPAFGGAKYRD